MATSANKLQIIGHAVPASVLRTIEQSPTTLIEAHAAAAATLRLGNAQSKVVLEVLPLMRGATGAKGEQGIRGEKGDIGGTFEFQQTAPSVMWTVNHNLGFRPAVKALTMGGVEVWAEVIHASNNQALIYFDSPIAGIATCS